MKSKPVIPRMLANRDIDEAIKPFLDQDAEPAPLGFIDALEQAYAHISKHGSTGSPRYAHELNLARLRFCPLARHPHRVFHIEMDDHIDVWRVLHGKRDIPAWMHQPDQSGRRWRAQSWVRDTQMTQAATRFMPQPPLLSRPYKFTMMAMPAPEPLGTDATAGTSRHLARSSR